MTNLILFDDPAIRPELLPFTFTRPVADIRVGILTIAEKWQKRLDNAPSFLTESYLSASYPCRTTTDNLYINGAVCPTDELTRRVQHLTSGEGLLSSAGLLVALRTDQAITEVTQLTDAVRSSSVFEEFIPTMRHLWSLIAANGDQIRADFDLLTAGRESQPITDPFTQCYAPENIFIEPGATLKATILNAADGPIYIGKNAIVSEGSVIVGPFGLGEGAMVHYQSRMRSNTSIGPYCKAGGEIANSIMFANSAKGHEGYLGDSVVGEWCNLGAGTNTSNLKNDYANVKLHNYATGGLVDTGRKFCGLMMGDFTKAGIGTLFNTGTVVGVNVNVYGGGIQPKHIPSFSWGGTVDGFVPYRIDKALQVAKETFSRRNTAFDAAEESILRAVYQQSQQP